MTNKKKQKPECEILELEESGENIFTLIRMATKTLRENGMNEQAQELNHKLFGCTNHDKAIDIISEYVEIV